MIKFSDDQLLLEIILANEDSNFKLYNHLDVIKNKKIYDEKIYDQLPGIVTNQRKWQLYLGDIIKKGK